MPRVTVRVSPRALGRMEKKLAAGFRRQRVVVALRAAGRWMVMWLRAQSRDIVYKGAYRDGWYQRVRGATLVISNSAPHFPFVEYGRRAGKKQPPLKPIRDWVISKGMRADAAFPVARAIGRRGIRARPLFTKASTQKRIESEVNRRLLRWFDQVLVRSAR